MNINIADNLKRLRKQREITQENLADFIGVSFQAVSKWERGEGYPDITILPVIAEFFEVSLDELVGMNEIRNSAKLEEIKEKHRELTSGGKIKEDIDLLKEAVRIFPNDWWLLAELACFLDGYGETDGERQKNLIESIKISERIIEFCTDSEIRNNVQNNVCFALWRNGDKVRAIRLAEKLPGIYKTRELTLNRFLDGNKKVEECQIAVQKLCWVFWYQIKMLAETEHYSNEEKINLYQKGIKIYELVYDSGDYNYSNIRLQEFYERIAKLLILCGKIDDGIVNIEKAAKCAVAFSALPDKQKYTSLLVNTLTYDKSGTSSSSEKNAAWFFKNELECGGDYENISNDDRVKKVIDELARYAN